MKYTGIIILFLSALVIISCEEKNEESAGNLEFVIGLSSSTELKSFSEPDTGLPPSDGIPFQIMVSLETENGNEFWSDKLIQVYRFGNGFITEKAEMPAGAYVMTKFMVLSDNGQVIYASPMAGSPKSFLVSNPLPLTFRVSAGENTRLSPEVLKTENSDPGDFGYTSFSFTVVDYYRAWVMAMEDNPLYYGPVKIIPARMNLSTPKGWAHTYRIAAETTEILVPAGHDKFRLLAEAEGLPVISREIRAGELKRSSKDNPFILRFASGEENVLSLQPGPEEGKDAMITDLDPMENFGDHTYFEASFITEPILTVMRTKRSIIHFDMRDLPEKARIDKVILTLHFERPLWDSLADNGQLDSYMLLPDLVLQQVIEPWKEDEVTWENQPQTIEANQVPVPFYPEYSTNMRSYDVTSLFVPVQEIAAPNYGMMFRYVENEDIPGGMRFVSSDYPVNEMRPKLEVHYYFPED